MAGGDGSQAVVAAMAAELDLPYACVPAGTRNHFALDLGVDRDDVVGALDAFVDGGERRVDLAEVNGSVFVNNVSLGLYAEAVQRPGYREAKLRTILDTVPEMLGPEGSGLDLAWRGPGGNEHGSGAAVLVSNNRYRLGTAVGSGRARGSTTGCSESRSSRGRRGAGRAASRNGRGASGRQPSSRCSPSMPFRPASTARRSRSTRRCDSGSSPASCACEFPRSTPGPLHPQPYPKPPGTASGPWFDIAVGRTPQTKET